MNDLPSRVAQLASDATFNRPLITNIFRGSIAEAIVSLALPDWRWVSADYSPYDFEHPDGTKLEVKQSSLRQSWVTANRQLRPGISLHELVHTGTTVGFRRLEEMPTSTFWPYMGQQMTRPTIATQISGAFSSFRKRSCHLPSA